MFYRKLLTAVLLCVAIGYAQGINRQLNDNTILDITRNGVMVSFSVRQAREMSINLGAAVDPKRPENVYFPPYLKEKLQWLKDNAMTGYNPIMPEGWDSVSVISPQTATMAIATYCTIPAPANWNDRPCIFVYPIMMMILLRFEFHLTAPDQRFKNEFAMYLGHEGIHLEREKAFFRPNIPHEEVVKEETRTWFKMCRDMVRPLRRAGQPVGKDLEDVDDLVKACGYKLPCRKFEALVRDKLASKR
jgi:hypothetical protein